MVLKLILLFIKIFIFLFVLDIIGIGIISFIRHLTIKKMEERRLEKEDV